MPVGSVKSFPVNPYNTNLSDSEELAIVGKCDLSPPWVRGFTPPHVDIGRNELTMKFKAPKSYNPVNQEPTIRTWLENMEMYLKLSNCPEAQRIGAIAMLLEGAAMTWYNGKRQQVRENLRNDWDGNAQYHDYHLSTCTNEPTGEDLCAR